MATIVAVVAQLIGCHLSVHPALRRFRNEYDCGDARRRSLGSGAHRVTGCGRSVTYVCGRGFAARCIREVEVTERHPVRTSPPARPAPPAPSRLVFERGRIHGDEAVRLRVTAGTRPELNYAPTLDAEHVVVRMRTGGFGSCDGVSLSGAAPTLRAHRREGTAVAFQWRVDEVVSFPLDRRTRLDACDYGIDRLTQAELTALRSFVRHVRSMSSPAASTPAAPTLPDDVRAAIREWLDGERETILGCVGGDSVPVRVQLGPGGTARVGLRPPRAGSPEEQCVTDALSARHFEGPRGVVIHVVR